MSVTSRVRTAFFNLLSASVSRESVNFSFVCCFVFFRLSSKYCSFLYSSLAAAAASFSDFFLSGFRCFPFFLFKIGITACMCLVCKCQQMSCYRNQMRLAIICQLRITHRQLCIQHVQWHSSIVFNQNATRSGDTSLNVSISILCATKLSAIMNWVTMVCNSVLIWSCKIWMSGDSRWNRAENKHEICEYYLLQDLVT